MRNPYEVLGIREGATKEQIKAAYHEQVKKYHPDLHQDNPLNELAQEKLKEINEAYDYLTKNGGYTGGGYAKGGGYTQGSGYGSGGSSGSAEFASVRQAINRGDMAAAQATLDRSQNRSAEWFFLKGVLNMRQGWYDDALNNLQVAVSMEPTNVEYRAAMNSLMAQSGGYQANANNRGYYANPNDEFCRMLQCFICADCLCDGGCC